MCNTKVEKNFLCQGFILFTFLLIFAIPCHAGVIFETNFDGFTWNASGALDGTECDQTTGIACANAPQGFTNYRDLPPGSGTKTTPWSSIGALPSSLPDHTTGSTGGHAFIAHYNEANYDGDSMISILFPVQYQELYIQVWLRAMPGGLGVVESSNSKMFRTVAIIPNCSNAYLYFSGGCAEAAAFNDFGAYGSAAPLVSAWTPSIRCAPTSTNYYCASSPNYTSYDWSTARLGGVNDTSMSTTPGQWNDGAWHRATMHVKMNSSKTCTAANCDGIYEVSYDGNTQIMHGGIPAKLSNLAYALAGSTVTGWNMVSLGGNTTSLSGLGWMAYDDLVISTAPIPADYVVGGGLVGPPAPPNASGSGHL